MTPHKALLAVLGLLVSFVLAGCAPDADLETATPSAADTPIQITLSGGRVSPNGERVNLHFGDRVTLVITSDRDDILHVHGFDTEIPVKAGKKTTATLLADRTGRYEVESHEPPMVVVVLQIS